MHFIFDLHRTLISTRISHGQFLASNLSDLDPHAFDQEFSRRMKDLEQDPINSNTIWHLNGANSTTSRQKWSELLVAATLATGYKSHHEKLLSICQDSYDRLSDPLEWFCFGDTHDALDRLVDKGHTISILSNFDSRGESIVSALLMTHPWRRIDFSFQSGLLKPDEGAFLAHCRLLDISSTNATMIGDDLWQDGSSQRIGLSFKRVNPPSQTLSAVLFDNVNE